MPRGGARPGAGRKPKAIEDWRRRMELLLASRVTEADAQEVVDRWVARLKAGDPHALWLVDRIFGKLRDEAKVEQSGTLRVEVTYADAGPPGPAAAAPGPAAGQGAG